MRVKVRLGVVCVMLASVVASGAMAHGGRDANGWRDRYEDRGVRVWVDPYRAHDRDRHRRHRDRDRDREDCDRDRERPRERIVYDERGRVLREVLPGRFMAEVGTGSWR
jgi:hypothetical protein